MAAIGFVGAGNMARALGGGLTASRSGPAAVRVVAIDPDATARARFVEEVGGEIADGVPGLLAASDTLVLAVKPQILPALLREIAPHLAPRHLVISIAAGITIDALTRGLGAAARIVRAMPNTPALVRRGITALVGSATATAADLALAETVFRAVGDVIVVADERLMDAITAVSGSGPGFLFAYAEAMMRAAEAEGLAPEVAEKLVQQTLLGSATLWVESGSSAAELRAMVTSPGGTTQAGLAALADAGFGEAVRAAVTAAARRSRELSGT